MVLCNDHGVVHRVYITLFFFLCNFWKGLKNLNVRYVLKVFEIISYLPRIRFLNLSDNPLCCSDPVNSEDMTQCRSISHLVLNATKVSWETVVQLLNLFPAYV